MDSIFVWVSDWGLIDVTQFNHLKFRNDGWLDGRRKGVYYKELKEYIQQKENELSVASELAWDKAKIDVTPKEINMNEKQYSPKSVSVALLCCPFCGNEPDFTESASANNEKIITFGVVCDYCGISLSANCVSLTIAADYWNTRTTNL